VHVTVHAHAGIHASPSSFLKFVPYFLNLLTVNNQANKPNMEMKLSHQYFDFEGHNP